MKKIALAIVASVLFSLPTLFAEVTKYVDLEYGDNAWVVWSDVSSHGRQLFYTNWDGKRWSDPQEVFQETHMNELTPYVTLDYEGRPWVAFVGEKEGDSDIFVSHWEQNSWTSPERITKKDQYYDGQPALVIGDDGRVHVVWVGFNGLIDTICYAMGRNGIWYPEKLLSSRNNGPVIDPTIGLVDKNIPTVVWSEYDNKGYRLKYCEKKEEIWSLEKNLHQTSTIPADSFPLFFNETSSEIDLLWFDHNLMLETVFTGTISSEMVVSFKLVNNKIRSLLSSIIPEQATLVWTDTQQFSHTLRYNCFQSTQETAGNYPGNKPNKSFANFFDLGPRSLFAEVTTGFYTAFGDSITAGEPPGDPTVGNYPAILQEKLLSTYGTAVVFNEGVGGEKTDTGLARIDSVLSSNDAEIILIMEGTNDVGVGRSPNGIAFNLEEMARRSIDFGTTPIMATVTPRLDGYESAVERLNVLIIEAAGRLGVLYADQFNAINNTPDKIVLYSDAHLHFNLEGNEILANTWLGQIQTLKGGGSSGGGGGGCGTISVGNGTGLQCNIMSLAVLFLLLLFVRRKLCYQTR